jgi:hypothetical protein
MSSDMDWIQRVPSGEMPLAGMRQCRKKLLVPRMDHCQKSDAGSEPAGIGGDGEQRLGNSLEKQVVNHLRIAKRQCRELCRQRKNDVTVRNGQKFLASCRQPVTLKMR